MRSRGSLTYDEALKLACEAKEINGSEYACPFAGCARKFARRVGIASHLRVHTAAEARRPAREASDGRVPSPLLRRSRRGSCSLHPAFDGLFEGGTGVGAKRRRVDAEERDPGDEGESESDEGDGVDAAEIASNALYFATQLRVARSAKVKEWDSKDYENALLWAHWIREHTEGHKDKASLSKALEERRLTLRGVDGAEVTFFDSVLGHEGVTEEMLGHLVAAAVGADAVDGTPNRSLSALAQCVSTAVTRRAVVDRLSAAVSHLDRCAAPASGGRGRYVPAADEVSSVSRAHVFLSRLARLPAADLGVRVDALMSQASAADLQLACAVVLEADASAGSANTAVSVAIRRRLLALTSESAAADLWCVDGSLLSRLSDNDFPIFRQYMQHLLARLQCCLWRLLVEDVDLVETARNVRQSARPVEHLEPGAPGTMCPAQVRRLEEVACAEARGLAGENDSHMGVAPVTRDIEARLLMLLSRCGKVGVVSRLLASNFFAGLSEPLRQVFATRFTKLATGVQDVEKGAGVP